MSPSFQKTLKGNVYQNHPEIKPANIWTKFVGLNEEMYRSNQRLSATHPYGSRWFTWPLMLRPIFYWNKDLNQPPDQLSTPDTGLNSRIYLIGNPLIWWSGTIIIFYLIFTKLLSLIRARKVNLVYLKNILQKPVALLWLGYFLNLLPFIGVKRVMFLYHYFPSLIFSILILFWHLDQIVNKNKKRQLVSFLIGGALILFLFFSPLVYGLPLAPEEFKKFFWFNSWR